MRKARRTNSSRLRKRAPLDALAKLFPSCLARLTFVVASAVGRVDKLRAGGARVTLSPKCRCRCSTMEEYLGRTLFANPSERETGHWRTSRNMYASGMTGGSALSSWSMLQGADELLSDGRKLAGNIGPHHCNFIYDQAKLKPASGAP